LSQAPFVLYGWGTRSRTSIRGVRVALRQEIKNKARRIKKPKILRKPEIEMDDGAASKRLKGK